MWALSLECVREQWKRIVFMQTNREDVGKRYYEVLVPFPKVAATAEACAQPFRDYFTKLREGLRVQLDAQGAKHHVYFA